MTRYRKADQIFKDEPIWTAVPDADRREIYKDTMIYLERKEKVIRYSLRHEVYPQRYTFFVIISGRSEEYEKAQHQGSGGHIGQHASDNVQDDVGSCKTVA